jgi:hypothetical protein
MTDKEAYANGYMSSQVYIKLDNEDGEIWHKNPYKKGGRKAKEWLCGWNDFLTEFFGNNAVIREK